MHIGMGAEQAQLGATINREKQEERFNED